MQPAPRKRNPDEMRQKLITAAFWEIYRNGFRAASLDSILAQAGATKGALYHHFASKTELGYAVVDEFIYGTIKSMWADPLRAAPDPITELHQIRSRMQGLMQPAVYGCPVNNLAQEMSPVDEGFRQRIARVFELWISSIADALEHGRKNGTVRQNVNSRSAATFILASLEGSVGLAKNAKDEELLNHCLDMLAEYWEGLRAVRQP